MHTPTLPIGTCDLHTDMVMIILKVRCSITPSSSPCQDSVSLRGSGTRTWSCQLLLRRTKDSRTSCTYSSFTCLSQITQYTHIIATGGIRFSKVILRMTVEGSWTHGILPCFLHRYLYNGFWGPVHSQETDSSCVKM